MDINNNTIYIINPDWSLRINGSSPIFFSNDTNDIKYILLSTFDGLIASMFDGEKNLNQICDCISYILNADKKLSFALVSDFLNNVNVNNPQLIIPKENAVSTDYKVYDPKMFVTKYKEGPRLKRLEVPLVLGITPTNRCMTDCIYCYAERKELSPKEELSVEEWKKIIDEANGLGIDRVELLGGDVFARKDSAEIIEHLLKYNMHFFISTKCHINEELAKRLSEAGMKNKSIQISMDAPDKYTSEMMTKCNGFYERSIDSINNLVKYGIKPRTKATITSYNAPMIPELIELWYNLGVKDMMLIDYGRSYYRHNETLFCDPDKSLWIKEQVEFLREKYKDAEIIYGAQSFREFNENRVEKTETEKWEIWKNRSRCSGGSSIMLITADGNVILCEQIPQVEENFVGNIKKQSILEIWNSKELFKYIYPAKSNFRNTDCLDCQSFEDCHRASGHCFRDALIANKIRFSPVPGCPMSKNKIRIS